MGLRARKDEDEIERVRRACAARRPRRSEQCSRRCELGVVERAVNARVDALLRERGATDSHPLVLFGANARQPARRPGRRGRSRRRRGLRGHLRAARRLLGRPDALRHRRRRRLDWARAAWALVRDAQAAAIAAARAGTPARDVDAAQRAIVEARPDLGALPARRRARDRRRDPRAAVPVPRTTAPLAAGHDA